MATHIRFRRQNGCPPDGKCQVRGYPYTSLLVLFALIAVVVSMPFVPGQASGLMAGIIMVVFYSLCYIAIRLFYLSHKPEFPYKNGIKKNFSENLSTEFSKELTPADNKEKDPDKK